MCTQVPETHSHKKIAPILLRQLNRFSKPHDFTPA